MFMLRKPSHDPDHESNSSEYHTGKTCSQCNERPAGTAWSKNLCQVCNAKRLDELEEKINKLEARYSAAARKKENPQ